VYVTEDLHGLGRHSLFTGLLHTFLLCPATRERQKREKERRGEGRTEGERTSKKTAKLRPTTRQRCLDVKNFQSIQRRDRERRREREREREREGPSVS